MEKPPRYYGLETATFAALGQTGGDFLAVAGRQPKGAGFDRLKRRFFGLFI